MDLVKRLVYTFALLVLSGANLVLSALVIAMVMKVFNLGDTHPFPWLVGVGTFMFLSVGSHDLAKLLAWGKGL